MLKKLRFGVKYDSKIWNIKSKKIKEETIDRNI